MSTVDQEIAWGKREYARKAKERAVEDFVARELAKRSNRLEALRQFFARGLYGATRAEE